MSHFNDEDKLAKVFIKGTSIIPKINLSSTFMRFSECPIKGKISKPLTIEN